MGTKSVLVVIRDDQTDSISNLVRDMRKAGLTVSSVMEDMGLVRGTIEESNVPTLEQVDGIEEVEDEEIIQLPPPHSTIQ